MNPRHLAFLAAATVVVVVLAAIAVGVRGGDGGGVAGDGEVAFPKLSGGLGQVAEVVVVNRDARIVVARKGGRWVLPEKHDYPAKVDAVRALLLGFEEMRLIERKTARRDRFERLNVDDPEGEETRAVRVTLRGADGEALADAVVGKKKYDLSRTGIAGTYVRRADTEQAWLGSANLDPGRTERLWLARRLVNVTKERIHRYTIDHADGERVAASRASPDDESFTLETLPRGGRLKSAAAADGNATTLAFLELEDVRPAAEVDFPEPIARSEFVTFDGLVVRIDVAEIDAAKWVRFDVGTRAPITETPLRRRGHRGRGRHRERAAGRRAGSRDPRHRRWLDLQAARIRHPEPHRPQRRHAGGSRRGLEHFKLAENRWHVVRCGPQDIVG